MPRGKQGLKSGRKERNLAFQRNLKDRKRLRKQRAEQFAHLPGQQAQHSAEPVSHIDRMVEAQHRDPLEDERDRLDRGFKVNELRQMAKDRGLPARSRDRKEDIIDMLLGEHPRLSS